MNKISQKNYFSIVIANNYKGKEENIINSNSKKKAKDFI
jgi:hypothetical protein